MATAGLTELLHRVASGDKDAEAKLIPHIYPELRKIARAHLRHERPDHTLQATALVNEAYIRIAGTGVVNWQSRVHFFRVAAQTMRRVLVDHARKRNASKRAGAHQVALEDCMAVSDENCQLYEDLDLALEKLLGVNARWAKVVELRYFGGMTEDEIAEVLGLSVKTVKRDWLKARAWLYGELSQGYGELSQS